MHSCQTSCQEGFSCIDSLCVSTPTYDVIVLGAGMSGVAAAKQLSDNGYSVLVLQANSYIGGRLKSIQIKSKSGSTYNFEEGGNWIHGYSQKNPLYSLSKQIPNVKLFQADYDDNTKIYDEEGQSVDQQAQNYYQKYIQGISQCSDCELNISILDSLKKTNPNDLSNKYFMYNVATDLQFETSGTIDKLSAGGWDDQEFEGPQTLVLSGFQRFVENLAKSNKFPVLLNHKVIRVQWSNGLNQVECSNGKVFKAEKIIISLPLGVLKAGSIQFQPELPQWKQDAIAGVGFGNVCKILIDFKNLDFFDAPSIYIGRVNDDVNKRGFITFFVSFQQVADIPALLTFGLGPNADEAEQMSEQSLKQEIAQILTRFSGKIISTQDFNVYRSTWRTQQNFRGAYSFISTSTEQEHIQNLIKPIEERGWYFCGEHTSTKYRGTAHGAYLSGVRIANLIDEKDD